MQSETDGALLAQFIATRSDAFFEELIRRHGQMVYNVCFRALGQTQDAEDAAQAVFIILGQKAASLTSRASVAGWLCLVARNVAQKSRSAAALRMLKEMEAEAMKPVPSGTPTEWNALKDYLDDELCALPEKYRLPIVLFHLEGNSTGETARILKCDEGTLRSRLSRGRELLNARLARRGAVLSMGLLAALISQNASAAALPANFTIATAKVVAASVAGHTIAGGVSAKVVALAKGGLKTLFYAKLKLAAAAIIAASLLASATIVAVRHAEAEEKKSAAQADKPVSIQSEAVAPKVIQPETAALKPVQAPPVGRVTITGMAKARNSASAKLDPAAANATLTATTKNDAGQTIQETYDVYGWAGVILAKQADGKKAEVTGYVAGKNGRKTITGKSVDAKIIVVDEQPAGGPAAK